MLIENTAFTNDEAGNIHGLVNVAGFLLRSNVSLIS